MATASYTPADVVRLLRGHYGVSEPLPVLNAFEWVVLENVAYLARPERRMAAFEVLRTSVGNSPHALLEASDEQLMRATAHGILAGTFADKVRECARIAIERFGGDLDAALDARPGAAVAMLRAFPGIGEPGAERILLFTGRRASLAPESNALRLLVRLGLVEEHGSYARTYAASRAVDAALEPTPDAMAEVHLLLARHGREVCKRTKPRCGECVLEQGCAYAQIG